jgi:hypothetical protein
MIFEEEVKVEIFVDKKLQKKKENEEMSNRKKARKKEMTFEKDKAIKKFCKIKDK